MAMVLDRIPAWQVGKFDIGGIAKDTIKEVADDDLSGLAAELTYRMLLALFPFLLFLAGLTSIADTVFHVPNLTEKIIEKASHVMGDDSTAVLRSFTDELLASKGGGAIGFGLIGALWAASSAMKTIIKAFNRVYDVKEDRGFVRRNALAAGLTVSAGVLMLSSVVLFATGRFLAGGLGEMLGWHSQFVTIWNIATPVVAVLLLLSAVSLLFWLAPNTGSQFRWVTPGTLLFLAGWFVFTIAFAFYLAHFGSYNRVYGSLAAVIILLIWLYWSNMLLLIGAELNAVLAQRYDAEAKADHPQKADANTSTGAAGAQS